MTDYYAQLGVARDADPATIRHAYKRRAQQIHPDKLPDDPFAADRFRLLREAYDCLRDPDRRAAYDATGGDPGKQDLRHLGRQAFVQALFNALKASQGHQVLDTMERLLLRKLSERQQRLQEIAAGTETLERALGRVTFKGEGENLFATAIENALEQKRQATAGHEQACETISIALELIGDYDEQELAQLSVHLGVGAASSTASTTSY